MFSKKKWHASKYRQGLPLKQCIFIIHMDFSIRDFVCHVILKTYSILIKNSDYSNKDTNTQYSIVLCIE